MVLLRRHQAGAAVCASPGRAQQVEVGSQGRQHVRHVGPRRVAHRADVDPLPWAQQGRLQCATATVDGLTEQDLHKRKVPPLRRPPGLVAGQVEAPGVGADMAAGGDGPPRSRHVLFRPLANSPGDAGQLRQVHRLPPCSSGT